MFITLLMMMIFVNKRKEVFERVDNDIEIEVCMLADIRYWSIKIWMKTKILSWIRRIDDQRILWKFDDCIDEDSIRVKDCCLMSISKLKDGSSQEFNPLKTNG